MRRESGEENCTDDAETETGEDQGRIIWKTKGVRWNQRRRSMIRKRWGGGERERERI